MSSYLAVHAMAGRGTGGFVCLFSFLNLKCGPSCLNIKPWHRDLKPCNRLSSVLLLYIVLWCYVKCWILGQLDWWIFVLTYIMYSGGNDVLSYHCLFVLSKWGVKIPFKGLNSSSGLFEGLNPFPGLEFEFRSFPGLESLSRAWIPVQVFSRAWIPFQGLNSSSGVEIHE